MSSEAAQRILRELRLAVWQFKEAKAQSPATPYVRDLIGRAQDDKSLAEDALLAGVCNAYVLAMRAVTEDASLTVAERRETLAALARQLQQQVNTLSTEGAT